MTSQLTVECRIARAENAYGLGCIGLLFKIMWYGGGGVCPVANRTRLGYVLSGPVNVACSDHCPSSVNMFHVMKTECQVVTEDFNANDTSLKEQLAKFWDYDTLGVKGKEEDFCEEYLTKVRFSGDRYEVSLPFKKEHPIIPVNDSLAQNRLASLLKRLKSSESKLLNQYDNVIKEQLDSGVVELIDKREGEVVPGTVRYIPHKEVLKEYRVVYDASAKSYSESSLNDCLLSGPALTPLLFDILLRLRLPKDCFDRRFREGISECRSQAGG